MNPKYRKKIMCPVKKNKNFEIPKIPKNFLNELKI
jgi:hypothetical protein